MPTRPLAAITGAAGHLGEALVRELLSQGWQVRALTRSQQGSLASTGAELMSVDLLEPASLKKAFEGVHTVFNLAAVISLHGDPSGLVWKTNVDGARNVAEAALACQAKKLVHCSSIQAFVPYPDDEPVSEERARSTDTNFPIYDRSKAEAELQVLEVGARGLPTVICNPTSVLGPFDFRPSRSGQLLLALARNQVPALPPGAQNWVDVRDIARGMVLASERGREGANYILGGHTLSLRELGALTAEATGSRRPLACPMSLAKLGIAVADVISHVTSHDLLVSSGAMEALTLRTRVSYQRAESELGYRPRPIDETLNDTYRFFQEQGWMPTSWEPHHG